MSKTIWALIEIEDGKVAHLGRAEAIVLGSAAAEVAATLGEFGAAKVYIHADAVRLRQLFDPLRRKYRQLVMGAVDYIQCHTAR